MAVSVTLNGGGTIIAWQTPSGIAFQRFDANHQPSGAVTSVATGPTVWLSAEALANGGFSIVWDTSASSQPMAQNYDANGVATGSTYTDTTPPIADIAFSSRAMVGTTGAVSTASTLLPDGGHVVATIDRTGGGGNLLSLFVQRYDGAGNPVGSQYSFSTGLALFSDPKITPLGQGGYAVSFINDSGNSSSFELYLFTANGTFVVNAVPVIFSGASAFPSVLSHSVAGLPNGGFVVCWTTNADGQMHAREFNSAGIAVGTERLLGIADTSQAAIIDVFPDGDYIVTWTIPNGVAHATLTAAGSPVPPADNDLIATVALSYTLPVGPHDATLIGNWAQSVTGNAQDNIITSNDYFSTLNGAGGNDTLIAGHSANILTGGTGADIFKFLNPPWNNTGHITDFVLGADRLDFSALFAAAGYSGSNPMADGFIRLQSDGAGGTRVLFDADGLGGNPWPTLVTTLDHVSPTGLTATQLFNPAANPPPPPPPPPPPTGGQTFTANDTRDQILTGGSGDDTFYAGHNSAVMTGNGGADHYIFQYLPWNGGHITDFASGDVIDLRPLFDASNYAGTNPMADGYLLFEADGSGNTKVMFDPDGPASCNPWAFLIVTLDDVQPSGIHSGDWLYA